MNPDIESVLIYIASHFQQPLSVKSLASVANLSEFHFHRVFRKETSTTPQKYVEKLRLEHAVHVIALNPYIKITHLAFDSGFQSPSSFSRAFSNYFGYPPTHFSQRYQRREHPIQLTESPKQMKELDICYLNGFSLSTQLTTADEECIQQTLDLRTEKEKEILFGVYLDPPMHKPVADCKYLIGTKTEENAKANYVVEGGYYLRMTMQGPFQRNIRAILEQHQRLGQSSYRIKYPLGIEKFSWDPQKPIPYLEISKELFIPVSR